MVEPLGCGAGENVGCPVRALISVGAARAADKASDLGDEGQLEKPYKPQEVVRRINLLRERRRAAPKT